MVRTHRAYLIIMDSWQSPLSSRYASKEMSNLFSNAVSFHCNNMRLVLALGVSSG